MKNSSALIFAAAVPCLAAAQPQEPIETIVVTASRVEQDARKVSASVTVLDRQDISHSQYQSLPDLLAWVTGIDITRDGGTGQNASIFTRGTNTSQTLILVDGVRVGSATLGYKGLGTVPLDNIERIEIIKGPRAAQYGSDAIGGVIQIFTRQSEGAPLVTATVGSNAFYQASVAAGTQLKQGHIGASVQHLQTDGYNVQPEAQADDDGHSNTNLSVNGNYKVADDVATSWYATYSSGDYDYDHSPGFPWHDQTDFENWHLNNQWTYTQNAWTSTLALGLSYDSEEYSGNDIPEIEYVTKRQQLNWNNEYRFNPATTFIFGYDGYKEDISDSSESFVDDDRINNAVYTGLLYDAKSWGTNLSVRNDHQTQFGDEATYQLGAYWQVLPTLTLKVNRGTGFKAPSFNDLYSPFGGNADLKAETSETNEIGLEWQHKLASVTLFYYETDVDDLIIWTPDDDQGFFWSPKNLNKASIEGTELDISYAFWGIEQNLGATWLDAKDDITGADLPKRADETYTWQGSVQWQQTRFGLNVRYQSSRPAGDFANTELGSYTLWNITVAHSFTPAFSAKLRVENLFDQDYQTNLGFDAPSREVYGSVEYQF